MITIKNLLSNDEIAEYQRVLSNSTWQDGKATAGHIARDQKVNNQLDQNSELARDLGDHILRKLGQSQQFMAAALPAKIYPPMFNRYQNGEHFAEHIDNAIRKIPGAPVKMRSDLSMTLFLSDIDTYEGGELQINMQGQLHSIKLDAGDMYVYPANTLHSVARVTKGCRYAACFWVQSLVKSHTQRQILHDLDLSIQALTQQDSKHPEQVRLSGVYHNLLREWSEI